MSAQDEHRPGRTVEIPDPECCDACETAAHAILTDLQDRQAMSFGWAMGAYGGDNDGNRVDMREWFVQAAVRSFERRARDAFEMGFVLGLAEDNVEAMWENYDRLA